MAENKPRSAFFSKKIIVMKNKIPFALDDECLIDVTKANKKQDYLCPDCNAIVRKRGGHKVKDHFYHYSPSDCTGESVIHKAYKTAFSQCKKISYRDISGDVVLLEFDKVELEKRYNNGSMIIDAVGYKDNDQYFIEFANTHFVDSHKMKKLKEANIFCLEISISKYEINTYQDIYNHLYQESIDKKVLHNPKTESLKNQYEELNKMYKTCIDRNKNLIEQYGKLHQRLKNCCKSYTELSNESKRIKDKLDLCIFQSNWYKDTILKVLLNVKTNNTDIFNNIVIDSDLVKKTIRKTAYIDSLVDLKEFNKIHFDMVVYDKFINDILKHKHKLV